MSSLLVFPGQGAQRSGMLQALSAEILQEASDALGEDVRRLDSAQALESSASAPTLDSKTAARAKETALP